MSGRPNRGTGWQLTIEGHTDSVGLAAYNQKLSTDRAEAVKAWLVAHGIDAGRLTSAGFVDTKPVADNAAESGRTQNRPSNWCGGNGSRQLGP